MSANDKQVGGEHYKSSIQHWDYVIANDLDYFQAQITKYVTRWKKKNGLVDLQKAMHFLEKYIELNTPKITPAVPKFSEVIITKGEVFDYNKHPDDYQEQLAKKMEKMREDAMTGVPDHMRDVAKQESALSPMLRNYLGIRDEDDASKPMSHGYINQDLPYIHKEDENV